MEIQVLLSAYTRVIFWLVSNTFFQQVWELNNPTKHWKQVLSIEESVKAGGLKGEDCLLSYISHPHLCFILASPHPAFSTCQFSALIFLASPDANSLWTSFIWIPSSWFDSPFDLAVSSQLPNRLSKSCLEVKSASFDSWQRQMRRQTKRRIQCLAGVLELCSEC